MRCTFETVVRLEGKTATMFEVPLDVRAVFGRARPPVLVTVNDHTYRSTVAVYDGRYYLPLNRTNRAAAGVEAGDAVKVSIEVDDAPRVVDVPDDLAAALAGDPAVAAAFDGLSYSHQSEYVEWIEEAKKPETRARRIGKAVERLREGKPQR